MKYLDKKIDILELDKNIINLLINNGIKKKIKGIWFI